jgi:hypothetical protein
MEQNIQKSLLNSPNNLITDLAWQVYLSLLDTGTEISVPLGSKYIAQVGQILAAANWANKPSQITSCSIDLDFDGDNECILSSENIFLTIEPMGGYIPFIFSIDQNGVHQIVGPTWEFTVGLSDITEWNLSKGVKSDPKQILGAFYDYDEEWETYDTFIRDNDIEIQNEDMSIRKIFTIDGNIIEITYQVSGNQNSRIQIPLVLDPWVRYSDGWGKKYIQSFSLGSINWGLDSGISIELRSTEKYSLYPFNATMEISKYPENPNFDYGRGHYLPFPMALAEAQANGDHTVDIIINP